VLTFSEAMTEPFAAIILAAGFSSRMGAFKPLLHLGEETALEKSVHMFRRAGIAHLQVIIGHQAEHLIPRLEHLDVAWMANPRYREGMFTSVQCAMKSLPEQVKAFFLQPVDMPLVRHQTLETLRRAWHATGRGIIHPVFWGKRGHPPLISTRYREIILQSRGEGGLKALLLPYAEDILEIEVPDEHCVLDMDTPQDYAYLRHRWEHYTIPSHRECEHLLAHRFEVPAQIAEHCRQVGRVAVTLADELARVGVRFDRELLRAACLLHDCCRDQSDHAVAGANALRQLGFGQVGTLVESHMDIVPLPGSEPSLQEVLYLADKLVAGRRVVSLEERFAPTLARFATQPSVLEAVRRRLAAAICIRDKCEAAFNRSVGEVLAPDALMTLEG
jgi:CTP:molybdopterin cytidylyltransferase MocA